MPLGWEVVGKVRWSRGEAEPYHMATVREWEEEVQSIVRPS